MFARIFCLCLKAQFEGRGRGDGSLDVVEERRKIEGRDAVQERRKIADRDMIEEQRKIEQEEAEQLKAKLTLPPIKEVQELLHQAAIEKELFDKAPVLVSVFFNEVSIVKCLPILTRPIPAPGSAAIIY